METGRKENRDKIELLLRFHATRRQIVTGERSRAYERQKQTGKQEKENCNKCLWWNVSQRSFVNSFCVCLASYRDSATCNAPNPPNLKPMNEMINRLDILPCLWLFSSDLSSLKVSKQ